MLYLVPVLLVLTAARHCGNNSVSPFDDLNYEEMKATADIIKASPIFLPASILYFPIIRTQEPIKRNWLQNETKSPRIAYAAVWDDIKKLLMEILVNLDDQRLIQFEILKDKLPPMVFGEFKVAKAATENNIRWEYAILRRGLDSDNVLVHNSPMGSSGILANPPGSRMVKVTMHYQTTGKNFLQDLLVEGVLMTVDINTGLVHEFLDIDTTNVSTAAKFSTSQATGGKPLKPLIILQPNGPSVEVKGQKVSWYKWKFHYSVDPIHGLQLYHLRFLADGLERSVIYKISLAEIFVPYGASGKTWRWKSPLDAGELGAGRNSDSLVIGVDVPENSILLDCVQPGHDGNPRVITKCVGIYEEDLGFLYKHTDFPFYKFTDSRRARHLVITHTAIYGNYEYLTDYILKMDGVIDVRVRLTGIIASRGVHAKLNSPSCIDDCVDYVNDYLTAPAHQHFFNFRIDFDIDGVENILTEIDITNDPIGPDNADGGAYSGKQKQIKQEGFRNYNFKTARSWHIINPNSRNDFGSPRGYQIKPITAGISYMKEGNPYLKQAQFVKHPLWFTRFRDTEQSAAGTFPRSGIPDQGLPQFIADKESIDNEDIVIWYTIGSTHVTRAEEWPIMNCQQISFSIIPFNFMSYNAEAPFYRQTP